MIFDRTPQDASEGAASVSRRPKARMLFGLAVLMFLIAFLGGFLAASASLPVAQLLLTVAGTADWLALVFLVIAVVFFALDR